jgi:hypothetical protein
LASAPVSQGGSLQRLYATNRWFTCSPFGVTNLYSLAVPPALYSVRLYFASAYAGSARPGQRVFDVLLNGATVAAALDLNREPGFLTAYRLTTRNVNCSGGVLQVGFRSVAENPFVSGIEVLTA